MKAASTNGRRACRETTAMGRRASVRPPQRRHWCQGRPSPARKTASPPAAAGAWAAWQGAVCSLRRHRRGPCGRRRAKRHLLNRQLCGEPRMLRQRLAGPAALSPKGPPAHTWAKNTPKGHLGADRVHRGGRGPRRRQRREGEGRPLLPRLLAHSRHTRENAIALSDEVGNAGGVGSMRSH